jgi:hypothetical protein
MRHVADPLDAEQLKRKQGFSTGRTTVETLIANVSLCAGSREAFVLGMIIGGLVTLLPFVCSWALHALWELRPARPLGPPWQRSKGRSVTTWKAEARRKNDALFWTRSMVEAQMLVATGEKALQPCRSDGGTP